MVPSPKKITFKLPPRPPSQKKKAPKIISPQKQGADKNPIKQKKTNKINKVKKSAFILPPKTSSKKIAIALKQKRNSPMGTLTQTKKTISIASQNKRKPTGKPAIQPMHPSECTKPRNLKPIPSFPPKKKLSENPVLQEEKILPNPTKDNISQSKTTHGDELSQYIQEIGKFPLLTREEEKKLAIQALKPGKRGQKARKELVERNLRFVISVARPYQGLGLDLSDLISEGNIGLHMAVERFNPHNGAKLITYAAWWIRQRIRKALSNQGKTIRVPVHMHDKISKIVKVSQQIAQAVGREPSPQEIAEETGVCPKKIKEILNLQHPTVALDAPLRYEEYSTAIGDNIKDENAKNPSDSVELSQNNDILYKAIATLPKREQAILKQRFGLNGYNPTTLEMLGKKFHITRERIRQIQNGTLKKLRTKITHIQNGVYNEECRFSPLTENPLV